MDELVDISPWSLRNSHGQDFLSIALATSLTKKDEMYRRVEEKIKEVIRDPGSEPTKRWSAQRWLNRWSSRAMDALMSLTGLRKVKSEALELFASVMLDMERPLEAQVSKSRMLHFAFVGNPGVGMRASFYSLLSSISVLS